MLQRKRLIYLLSLIGLSLVMLTIGIIIYYRNSRRPEIYLDNRELSIKILNGCGVSGIAKEYENFLVKKYSNFENHYFKFSAPSNTRKWLYNKSIIMVSRPFNENKKPTDLEVLIERTGIDKYSLAIDTLDVNDYDFLLILGNDFQNLMKK